MAARVPVRSDPESGERPLEQSAVKFGVAAREPFAVAALAELLEREGPRRIEQAVARDFPLGLRRDDDFATRLARPSMTSDGANSGLAATASRLKTPANTARWRRSTRSGSGSSSELQSSVAATFGAAAMPSAGRQVEAIIEAGGELPDAGAPTRAAASSIASGMPSSRRQIAVITAARRRSSAKCGSAARARSRNSRPAPYRRRSP